MPPAAKCRRVGDSASASDTVPTEQWIRMSAAFKAKYKHQDFGEFTTLDPRVVGVHPLNRDGVGLSVERVHDLGARVFLLGTDQEEPQGGCCVCEEDGGSLIKDFNESMVRKVPGFPPADSIRFGSLEHGHFNFFLRCLSYRCKSSNEGMTVDGHLSVEKVRERDPVMAQFALVGLRWRVLAPAILADKEACRVISAAANALGQMQMKETEMSLILRMSDLCRASAELGENVIKGEVLKKVLSSQSATLQDAMGFLEYVRCVCTAGRGRSNFVEDLRCFYETYVPPQKRRVRGSFFMAVAKSVPPDCPLLMNAILKAQYMCAEKCLKDGVCEALTGGPEESEGQPR